MTEAAVKVNSPSVIVSTLTEDKDLLKLFPLIMQELKELKVDLSKVNNEKVLASAYACKIRGAVIKAENEKGEIVGAIGIVPNESFWSDEITLVSLMLFVDPAYRKSGVGLDLINKAKEYALAENKELNIFVDSDVDLDKKDRMFVHCGFTKRGGTYRFNGVK